MTLSFHVRHEVTSDRCFEVLNALYSDRSCDQVVQAKRQLSRLSQLNLVDRGQITSLGNTVINICGKNSNLWGELLHFLHYTLWSKLHPEDNGFSWTYQAFTDYLWEKRQLSLDDEFWSPVVATISGQIETNQVFQDRITTATKEGTISLSKRSLTGIVNWLEVLIPPVIKSNTFTRRNFCPPELTLLAAGWIAQTMEGEIGIDFLITPPRREAICRLCLLEPNNLDKVLDWMLPNYPEIVQPGTSAGVYGRYLRFLKWPEIADLRSS